LKPFCRRFIKETADGSHTLFLPGYNEHYHSVHGALSESVHVFIREGFDVAVKSLSCRGKHSPPVLNVLEVGFGSGLNALLTLDRSRLFDIQLHYHALEPYPITKKEASGLNLPAKVAGGELAAEFFRMHNAPFGRNTDIAPGFVLFKHKILLQDALFAPGTFRLVYHDAFAPQLQPELWDRQVFAKLYSAMAPGAVLVTYSAGGGVKRALKDCGFYLTHPPGPAGKREMTRAEKPA